MEQKIRLPVRQLVEFVLRGGSIDSRFGGSDRALEGGRIHRRLQKEAGEGYQAEVRFVHHCVYQGTEFTIEGRADGIYEDEGCATIDEIKTTAAPTELLTEDFNRLHWAQAICYAYFYAVEQDRQEMQVRLTYFQIETEEIIRFLRRYNFAELEGFFLGLLERYKIWADFQQQWQELRDASIRSLSFPFSQYRAGQRELAVAVYRAIQKGRRLYCQAPTGIGKTISTLFPAVKAMGEGLTEKIFYLTAKTITRQAAEEAFSFMRQQPLRLKTVTLTAKDKICFLEERRCNPLDCPYANGHFDRVNDVLLRMLKEADCFTRPVIEAYAKEGQVCPFELGLDLTTWSDCIICDYNYLFDPTVNLKRFFAEGGGAYTFLIDEAHNLVDRAREMYSARLSKSDFTTAKKLLSKGQGDKKLRQALNKADAALRELRKGCEDGKTAVFEEPLAQINQLLPGVISKMEEWLQQNPDAPAQGELLEFYFTLLNYQRTTELYDSHYVTLLHAHGYQLTATQFCRDPSALVANALEKGKAAVLFSATLSPLSYYQSVLGGNAESHRYSLPSPFPQENLALLINDRISTRYQDREGSCRLVAENLLALAKSRAGNYMAFFPSYSYCREVYQQFTQLSGNDVASIIQEAGLTEEQREEFLARFREDAASPFMAFCVLGGIFSEGIDLKGSRLIGAAIVGVGLPQIGPEPDVIREYYQKKNGMGFAFAYQYPGMNKVLQAAGRVIRGSSDRGVVLLLDDRFTRQDYRALFPSHWSHFQIVRNTTALESQLSRFWAQDHSQKINN